MTDKTENVPEWALREFCKRANLDYRYWFDTGEGSFGVAVRSAVKEGGKLIAAHEEAPVDPLLDEAQSIGDDHRLNFSAMPSVERAILAALRRGIELGRSST